MILYIYIHLIRRTHDELENDQSGQARGDINRQHVHPLHYANMV